jgi:hypothetical protein
MLKFFKFIAYFLERSERNYPRIFWLCTSLSGFLIFHEPIQNRSQSQVVIEQVHILHGAGSNSNSSSFVTSICLNKRKNFDPAFHRRLTKHFPDWSGRMIFQKKQEGFYKSAMQKKREALRLRLKENFNRTSEEQDAVDYFNGTGIYVKFQDIKTKPNIFDTRQSFLQKMHDPVALDNFLNSFNRINN